jgi:hypothetical protein
MPLVGEAYGNTIVGERPQFLDEPVVQLSCPFAREERNDFRSSTDEFRTVPPS